ncbi:cytochrome P450 [Novosphingobium sp. Gsoil 351]|uniref:cytochrome P450 n=1 Tax=Novosphingobium sp. Gsoil 351 TaxID=2675225 RepID=UPI0012B4FF82|nr:cytochrome P450 [Novosphingobium sp. Gsoil 351]QGN54617.1 cytochrome P450 [Novosphingobium sp. Gsoil 351]
MNTHPAIAGHVPDHVPLDLVYDFDIYADARVSSDVQRTYAEAIAHAPDIFWSPANGGHWLVKRFDAIAAVATDPEHFSVREMQIPRVENPPFFIPLSLDPPDNLPYRRVMAPMFGPAAIKALEPRLRHWAQAIVADVAHKRTCDFMGDVAKVFPVTIFMELMGMDLSRLHKFRHLAERFFEVQNDAAEMARLSATILGILRDLVEEKRAKPDEKLMSHFIHAEIEDGRVMSDDEILAMSFVLFLGGMDTVTNVTGFAFQQLAQMPELQARLAANPAGLSGAFADEAVRAFGVVNSPRLVVKDKDLMGVPFRVGDMVLNLLPVGSRDERRFENPHVLDIDRKKTAHITFSTGPHLCIGHVLGRAEIRVLAEEWMRAIPRFQIVEGAERPFRTGTVMALEKLQLEWGA